ncbi:unnamed protein product [Soboliphyme baturini]|uniref:DUF2052 domain-containing protein n=1 Tax=Soboliphyme baturini TaxID=241478 RepID=A0A183JAG4_9BILA|nr:unnamed protein product [Soboliphyme baturini]
MKNSLKKMYGEIKSYELDGDGDRRDTVPELFVSGFDMEQIWQQIELQNRKAYEQLSKVVSSSSLISCEVPVRSDEDLVEDAKEESENSDDDEMVEVGRIKGLLKASTATADDETDDSELFNGEDFDTDEENQYDNAKDKEGDEGEEYAHERKSHEEELSRTSAVEDRFFSLTDMESFLEEQDKLFETGSDFLAADENYDYFCDTDKSDDGRDYKYSEFFDPPKPDSYNSNKRKRVHFAVDNKQRICI